MKMMIKISEKTSVIEFSFFIFSFQVFKVKRQMFYHRVSVSWEKVYVAFKLIFFLKVRVCMVCKRYIYANARVYQHNNFFFYGNMISFKALNWKSWISFCFCYAGGCLLCDEAYRKFWNIFFLNILKFLSGFLFCYFSE